MVTIEIKREHKRFHVKRQNSSTKRKFVGYNILDKVKTSNLLWKELILTWIGLWNKSLSLAIRNWREWIKLFLECRNVSPICSWKYCYKNIIGWRSRKKASGSIKYCHWNMRGCILRNRIARTEPSKIIKKVFLLY